MCWGLIFPVQDPQAREVFPLFLGKNLEIVIILSFVGYPFRSMGLGYIMSPPFLPTLFWFPHYSFSCRISFLLIFWSFSSKVYCIDGKRDINRCYSQVTVRQWQLPPVLLYLLVICMRKKPRDRKIMQTLIFTATMVFQIPSLKTHCT